MQAPNAHTDSSLQQLLGMSIAERYRLEAVLGMGAMGVVFRAHAMGAHAGDAGDAGTGPLALKLVLPDPQHPRTVSRILRGARLAAQLKHPHVVGTLGYGRLGPRRDACYVAMELVDGLPLGRLLGVELDSGAICTLMSQVLDALAHVHARGILHRDIKPDNIFVIRAGDGRLWCKIGDFGIAAQALARADDVRLTQPGMVVGTPIYMAPEQATGNGPDTPALDLYPIGVMLYELLGGRPPFSGPSAEMLIAKLTREPPPLVPRGTLQVPPALHETVMRLLARQPHERYAFASDVLHALAPFCGPAVLSADAWQSMTGAPACHRQRSELDAWGQQAHEVFAEVVPGAAPGAAVARVPAAKTASAVHMPLVGRDELLDRLERLASQAEQGLGSIALLTGNTGIGKSALLDHVVTGLAETGRFLVLRVALHGALGLQAGLRQVLEAALGTKGRSEQHVEQVVGQMLGQVIGDNRQEIADLVAFLRPRSGKGPQQAHGFALVYRCLQRFSTTRPVLLAMDDLHEGGADAAALLEFLLFQCGFDPVPMLVVATANHETMSETFRRALARTDRFEGTTRHTMVLPPLDRELLASALARHLHVRWSQAQQLAQRSAGNPLFAMHLAQTVLDARGAGQDTRSSLDSLPRALHGMLENSLHLRLARTQDPARYQALLEVIAVLGAVVEVSLLQAFLADDTTADQLGQELDTCLDQGLLESVDLGTSDAVAFAPAMLREVLLAGLHGRRARRLHSRAIEVRKQWAAARLDAEAGALGDHCAAIGQQDEAVDWWLRGQAFELSGGNALRGVEWGLKALAALQPSDARHVACAMPLGRTLLDAGDAEAAEKILRPVVDSGTADAAMLAGDVLADVYENLGAGEAWTRLITQLEAREHEASPVGRWALHVARTMWRKQHDDLEGSHDDGRRALALAQPGEQSQRAAQRLVIVHLHRGELEQAAEMAELAVRESGQRVDLRLRSLRMLGVVAMWQGRGQAAAECHQEVVDLCRRTGLIARIPIALYELGNTLRAQMEIDAAELQYQAATRAAQELGLVSTIELSRIRQVMCDLWQGRTSGILPRIHEWSRTALRAGLALSPSFYNLMEIWAHAIDGNVELALSAYARIDDLGRLALDVQFAVVLQTIASQLLRAAAGRPLATPLATAIRTMLEAAVTFIERFPALGSLDQCQCLLAEL